MQTRQLWLDLAPKGGAYRQETFVDGHSNALARKALRGWRDWPGNVLALTGPAGCGKSHLAHLWSVQTSARKTDLHSIPRTLQGFVLIEDLPSGMDEQALFRVINAAARADICVLLTSTKKPRLWKTTLPDLSSRLAALHTIAIDEPDDVVLTGVLNKLFADRQIAVDKPVVAYLLSRMERSTAAALEMVERIHSKAHEQGQNIRLPLIRSVLQEMQHEADLTPGCGSAIGAGEKTARHLDGHQ